MYWRSAIVTLLHLDVEGETVLVTQRESGTDDFRWLNGPLTDYGFLVGSSRQYELTVEELASYAQDFRHNNPRDHPLAVQSSP